MLLKIDHNIFALSSRKVIWLRRQVSGQNNISHQQLLNLLRNLNIPDSYDSVPVPKQIDKAELELKKLQEKYAVIEKFGVKINEELYLGLNMVHVYEKGYFGLCFMLPLDHGWHQSDRYIPALESDVVYLLRYLCGLFVFPYRKTNFMTLKKTMFHCFGNNLHQYVPIYSEKGKVLWPD